MSKLTSFRTTDEIRDKLAEAAKTHGVSVNQEINERITKSFDQPTRNRKDMTMNDLPDNVDLQWVGRTLLAIQREQSAIRDELLVFSDRLNRIDATIDLAAIDIRAVRNDLTRMRVRMLES